MENNTLKITGKLKIKKIKANGQIESIIIPNTITTRGKYLIAALLSGVTFVSTNGTDTTVSDDLSLGTGTIDGTIAEINRVETLLIKPSYLQNMIIGAGVSDPNNSTAIDASSLASANDTSLINFISTHDDTLGVEMNGRTLTSFVKSNVNYSYNVNNDVKANIITYTANFTNASSNILYIREAGLTNNSNYNRSVPTVPAINQIYGTTDNRHINHTLFAHTTFPIISLEPNDIIMITWTITIN